MLQDAEDFVCHLLELHDHPTRTTACSMLSLATTPPFERAHDAISMPDKRLLRSSRQAPPVLDAYELVPTTARADIKTLVGRA